METAAPRFSFPHPHLMGMMEQGCVCETVTVDRRGQIVYRATHHVRRFIEPLSQDVVLEMVAIGGGVFYMGSDRFNGFHDERPRHLVRVAPFLMARYPITQQQWRAVMGRSLPWRGKGPLRPVDNVSWFQARAFAQRLTQHTGRPYALPSEAQWEYACRAGTSTPFYCGETLSTDLANYCGNHTYRDEAKGLYRQGTTEVGGFPPNAFGMHDMLGNLWEWCADRWHENYVGAPDDDSPWDRSGEDKWRVGRGGCWHDPPHNCRSSARLRLLAEEGDDFYGFRVTLPLRIPPPESAAPSHPTPWWHRVRRFVSSLQFR